MKCTECKTELSYGAKFYQCSVSTCNRSRMRLVFCSVICWDSHLADARHRDAWAEEANAPTREAWQRELATDPSRAAKPATLPPPTPDSVQPSHTRPAAAPWTPPSASPPSSFSGLSSGPVRRVVGDASPVSAAAVEGLTLSEVTDRDVLIVVSKMKKYIKDRSGMNCSDAVADMISEHVRLLCDEAIRAAARDERKTVLDRDVTRVRR